MAFSIGSFAGGLSEGIQNAEDIKSKQVARRAAEQQIQAEQERQDSLGRAKAVGLAIPQVGAVLPQGYDQQTAMQAAVTNYDAKNTADRTEQARSPISRVISALSPHKVALTAASAGVGMPLLPGVPTNGTAPVAPAAPAPTAVAPTTPLPVGQDTSAAEQITGVPDAAPTPAAPAARKPRVQTMEDSYKMLAYQSQIKGDTKGALEAMEKAGQLHANSVLKALRGATPAAMSRVLTEIMGETRDVVEKDGAYEIRDGSGNVIHKYASFEAMYGDVKATVDDDATIGVNMVMKANQEARDQARAAAEIRSHNATAAKIDEETKWVGPRAKSEINLQGAQAGASNAAAAASRAEVARGADANRRAEQIFGYQLSDLEEGRKAKEILADPSNAITQPEKWKWASRVNQERYPTMKTSNEELGPDNSTVLRKQGNAWEEAGDDYRAAFAKSQPVKDGRVKIATKDGKPIFTYQQKDGRWAMTSDPDEALHEAQKAWGGQIPAMPRKGQPAAAPAAPVSEDMKYAVDAAASGSSFGGAFTPQQRAAHAADVQAKRTKDIADLNAYRVAYPGRQLPPNLAAVAASLDQQRQGVGVR